MPRCVAVAEVGRLILQTVSQRAGTLRDDRFSMVTDDLAFTVARLGDSRP